MLNLGTLLAAGSPAEVQRNQAVRDAYLGETDTPVGSIRTGRSGPRRGRRTTAMNEFWNLVFSGLVTGAIYGIMASGLVLTYTTSGIFNFAHGAVAFATAYLYYQLNTGLGVPIVPALIICGVHLRPAARTAAGPHPAPPAGARHRCTPRIVGTIGLLVALPALIQWLVVAVGQRRARPRLQGQRGDQRGCRPCPGSARRRTTPTRSAASSSTPTRSRCSSSPRSPRSLLWFVIRRTRVGLEMRAVVDRESLAGSARRERRADLGGRRGS